MMTYQHWKTQTKRGLTAPRSKKLKVIDDAFEAYEKAVKARQPTTRLVVTFFDALLAWIQKKGTDWKNSTRNSKIEAGGKGTVETLLNELVALNPAFRVKAAPLLSQSAPPAPPLMQHGKKNHHVDVDGHHYDLIVQNKENSCGPASIRTVIKLVKNEDVAEDYLRELVEIAEEGGAYGGSLGQGGVILTGGAHDWDPSGGGTWLVPAALSAAKIPCTQGTSVATLLRTTNKKPAIAVVAWTGGGLHYVVVAGKTKQTPSKLVILDPYYGLQYVGFAAAPETYRPVDSGGTVLSTATWHPWVCSVN